MLYRIFVDEVLGSNAPEKRPARQELIDEANRLHDAGFSLEQIAESMQLSVGSARKWLSLIPSWVRGK